MLRILLIPLLLALAACFGGQIKSPSDMSAVRDYVRDGAEQEHWLFVPTATGSQQWQLAKLVSPALQESFPEKAQLHTMGAAEAQWWSIDRLQLLDDLLASKQPCLQIEQYGQWHAFTVRQLQQYIQQPAALAMSKPAVRWLGGSASCN